MEPWQIVVLVGSLLLLVGGLALYFWLRQPPPPERLPPRPLVLPEKLPHVQLSWEDSVPFIEGAGLEGQSAAWRRRMAAAGQVMTQAGVQQIYFLHGTFTGSDPLNVLPPLKNLMPHLATQWEKIIESKMKRAVDRIARDIGNFLPSYVQLFHDAIGQVIPCHTLHWSSANNHWGRLQGAIRLIDTLGQRFPDKGSGRVLLIGHSHARQVFALFTQLISDSALGKRLWELIQREQLGNVELLAHARRLSHISYDFVTLGGPLRYPFAPTDRMRFLHFINHRGNHELADHILTFWSTAGGDYVQQWGCAGSDSIATTAKERELNRQLDDVLGKGIDTRVWVHTVAGRQRMGDLGRSLLINYRDHGGIKINCIATVFGHGIYTRYRVMLFNTSQICCYLYERSLDDMCR